MSDSTGTAAPQPGWYPNPSGDPGYRWWDGRGWTEHVRAPEPAAPLHQHDDVPARAVAPEPQAGPAAVPAPASVTEPETTVPTRAEADDDRPRYGERVAGYGTSGAAGAEATQASGPYQGDGGAGQARSGAGVSGVPYGQAQGSQQPDGQQPYGSQYGQAQVGQNAFGQNPYGQAPGSQYGAQPYGGYYGRPGEPLPSIKPDTRVTPWFAIVMALLPLISGIGFLLVNFEPFLEAVLRESQTTTGTTTTLPPYPAGYGVLQGVDFLVYLVAVLLAFFDYRRLRASGVAKPFHWAFAFIPALTGGVYMIGRAVVLHRRGARGFVAMLPLWIWIVANVVTFLLVALKVVGVIAAVASSGVFDNVN